MSSVAYGRKNLSRETLLDNGISSSFEKLDLINLSKSFDKDNFDVLKDINLSIKKGKFVCILGPSGCGKTVLLYLIAGFLKPTSGIILIDGKPILDSDCDRTIVFQNYVLFPWKTVYENVLFALENSSMVNYEKNEIVMNYLEIMGIASFRDWYPYKLSGGMQQRVALARALATNPRLLLLDEPFSALDFRYRKFLTAKLEEIWQKTKKTIILVTHDVKESVLLADEIYLLSAHPTLIKELYRINIPRPRDTTDKNFVKICRKIENDICFEIDSSARNDELDNSLFKVLKLSGRKGVL